MLKNKINQIRKTYPFLFYFILIIILLETGILIIKLKTIIDNKNGASVKFSQDIRNVTKTVTSKIVKLNNGDTFNLNAHSVKNNINGSDVKMLGYNGSIPGPLIRVKKGSEITISFTNDTDVPSTLHSHGIRLDNRFDGVPDLTQEAVKPKNSFTYKLKFPDEGIYWYHPHVREDYAQEMGLYGNFIVEPENPNYWNPVNREIALFLDDILMDGKKIEPFSKTIVNYTLMGRFGNTMLVNGKTDYKKSIHSNEIVRFFVTNSANTRVFNLHIPNAKIKRVGGDNGRYEKESFVDSVIIGPSERTVIEVFFEKPGVYSLIHQTPDKRYKLGEIEVKNKKLSQLFTKEFLNLRTNPDFFDVRKNFPLYIAQPVDKILNLSIDMSSGDGMMHHDGENNMNVNSNMMSHHDMPHQHKTQKIEWEDSMGEMNVRSNNRIMKWKMTDTATNKSNMDIHWEFKKGDMVKLRIFNDANMHVQHPMQHPIHIHGQRFLVLSTNGTPNNNLVWKDTTLVQTGDAVDLLVDMSNPGDWMIHCHIPEHMESGMMSTFKVL